ncbi:MAG: sensor histidine kinase [Leptospiraceae bacterium]|nr:sensor histidine kinase [Leptospiraceae bacterium]
MHLLVLGYSDNLVNICVQAGHEANYLPVLETAQSGNFDSINSNDIFLFDLTDFSEKGNLSEILKILKQTKAALNYAIFSNAGAEIIRDLYENGIKRVFYLETEKTKFLEIIELDFREREKEISRNFSEKREQEKMKARLERESVRSQYRSRDLLEDAREIVRRLRNNFGNDSGIGAIITIADVLSATAIPYEDGMIVNKDFLEGLSDSAKAASGTFNAMNLFLNLTEAKPKLEAAFLTDIAGLLDEIHDELKETVENAGIQVYYEREQNLPREIILCDKKSLKLIFKELIVNALRFSARGDIVQVLPVFKPKTTGLMVLNPAHESRNKEVGIPVPFENKVFEAFYRMSDNTTDSFLSHQIMSGLGLGLTLIQRLVQFHNGDITISNIENYSLHSNEKKIRVIAEVSLPLQ